MSEQHEFLTSPRFAGRSRVMRAGGGTVVFLAVFAVCILSAPCLADGPSDNKPDLVRPIPPVGIEVDAETKSQLLNRARKISLEIQKQRNVDEMSRNLAAVLPRAVQITLETGMIYADREVKGVAKLLDEATRRLSAIQTGASRIDLLGLETGPVGQPQLAIGGFKSRIDGSIQPYGLVFPVDWDRNGNQPLRLDVWLHGRGERSSEVSFLSQRLTSVGQYAPKNTVVLHPYGRYCNAFKFAGEIDVIEAIKHVKQLLPIDDRRIAIRGFSMGGAGCWQLAVHYPDLWVAANPGAGFSETTEFLRVFQKEDFKPTWYQKQLLHWYDCPDWTNNLRNVPTVAYSGEIDKQKQAADIMDAAYLQRGMKLPHIIGPNTAHKIHAESKVTVQSLLDQYIDKGKQTVPRTIDLTTYSLRYHRLGWLSIEGLKQHWHHSRVQGRINPDDSDASIWLKTDNVTRLKLDIPAQIQARGNDVQIAIDGETVQASISVAGFVELELGTGDRPGWSSMVAKRNEGLSKRPGLQGPIDDAFMSAFVFVSPTSIENPGLVDRWIQDEYARAKLEWRRHFRGDINEVRADAVTDADISNNNLILFGTPNSNPMIAKIVAELPIAWTQESLRISDEQFNVQQHVPLLIYPNPLNPERYVVLNSSFTYREFAYLNNARQIPMLPDWAIVDVSSGSTSQHPGNVRAAGFFDEQWQ